MLTQSLFFAMESRYSSSYLCNKYGDLWPDDRGFTANDACCRCGGGIRPTSSPSTSPVVVVQNDNCQDLDFTDSWGDGCSW